MEDHKCSCKDELSMNDYQDGALRTANVYRDSVSELTDDPKMQTLLRLLYVTTKLAGEAGEVAEKVGKIIRDHNGIITDELAAELAMELGDVLWYGAATADEIDYPLEVIAQANLDKLARRALTGKLKGSGDKR